jgi:hypothetical protein
MLAGSTEVEANEFMIGPEATAVGHGKGLDSGTGGKRGEKPMSNKLMKRHKRQVARAKDRVKLSEPDVRTAEQLRAARAASQPAGGWRNSPNAHYAKP